MPVYYCLFAIVCALVYTRRWGLLLGVGLLFAYVWFNTVTEPEVTVLRGPYY